MYVLKNNFFSNLTFVRLVCSNVCDWKKTSLMSQLNPVHYAGLELVRVPRVPGTRRIFGQYT